MGVLDLTRSNARRRLWSLLFANPQREVHLRDLSRQIGMSIGAVQFQVGKLEREGWLKRRRLGNLALFSLNQNHPLYRETEALVAKTLGIAPLLAQTLASVQGVRLAFIYGSYVSVFAKSASAWSAESDVDLMVVGKVDPRSMSRVAREAGGRTGRQINYTILGVQELKRKAAKRDFFLEDILSKPILPMVGFPESGGTPIRRRAKTLIAMLERDA